ncbi:MAG: hypothetical protein H0T84_08365 [Tatlockia sp.]|nr:hypothetical protein [Tatlockia sp.]
MDKFNKLFSFIFINSKINTLLFFEKMTNNSIVEPLVAKIIYKKQIRRFLGLGFFLSFIPGTDAFKARDNLFETILQLESQLRFNTSPDPIKQFMGWLITSPLHIFFRTFVAITYENLAKEFPDIIFRKEDIGGVNRLNPFLYPTKLFCMFLDNNNTLIDSIFFNNSIPFILRIPIYAVGAILIAVFALIALLYFTTELILNCTNTLLVEPFRYAFETIYQLVTSWNLDFRYIPSADYPKINKILHTVDKKLIDAEENSALQAYQTPDLTLIESTDKIIAAFEKHQNSLFYRINKDKNLVNQSRREILNSYNELENLRTFSYFTHKEMPNLFDSALTQKIIDTYQNLNFA